jgi:hypothetical protein
MLRTKKQSQNEIELAASTALRYSDSPKNELSNVRMKIADQQEKELKVFPIDDKTLEMLRI